MVSRSREQRPLARLLGYIRLAPWRYTVGIALTLAYAVMFQLIPLQVRSVVAVLEEVGAGRAAVEAARRPALGLVIVSLVFAVFRFSSRIVLFRLGRQIEYRIRNDYFEQIQRLPASFFARHRTGDLMSRAINDIAPDPTNPDRAFAVVSGFNVDHLWEWNRNVGWTERGTGLPNVPANSALMFDDQDMLAVELIQGLNDMTDAEPGDISQFHEFGFRQFHREFRTSLASRWL